MIVLIPIMAFLCRACGASWNRFPQLEIVFTAPFGLVAYLNSGIWWVGAAAWIISYLGFQTGHGNFFEMKGVSLIKDEPEAIEPAIRKSTREIFTIPSTAGYAWVRKDSL